MKYVVLDFETTGLNHKTEEVTEVGIVIANENFQVVSEFQTFVKIKGRVPEEITELTGITQQDVDGGMAKHQVSRIIKTLLDQRGVVVVCQQAPFDLAFLAESFGIYPGKFVCTRTLSSIAEPFESASLTPVCSRWNIDLSGAHRALNDCGATLKVLELRKSQGVYVEDTVTASEERPLTFMPRSCKYVYNLDDLRATAPELSDLVSHIE